LPPLNLNNPKINPKIKFIIDHRLSNKIPLNQFKKITSESKPKSKNQPKNYQIQHKGFQNSKFLSSMTRNSEISRKNLKASKSKNKNKSKSFEALNKAGSFSTQNQKEPTFAQIQYKNPTK
jgi:hypothetical protein